MTLDEMEAAFRADLDRALGSYDGDRVDIDLRIRDADAERLDEMLSARSVMGRHARVRREEIGGMVRRLQRPANRCATQSYSIDMSTDRVPRVTIDRFVWRSP